MRRILSKSSLAIALSGLKGFESPKIREEQYTTDSEIAANVLWSAYLLGDIQNRVIADLGCGTGILGIGALLLGANDVFFIDVDKIAIETAKNNFLKLKSDGYALGKVKFLNLNIKNLKIRSQIVIQNPPFGTRIKHNDLLFLEKALEIAPIVYSFHKSESKGFLEMFSSKKNIKITHIWSFKLPLKASFSFHRRQIHRINASCFRFQKIGHI